MPRAPHSRALLAGRPLQRSAGCSPAGSRCCRSTPLQQAEVSTRLTSAYGLQVVVFGMPDVGVRRVQPGRGPGLQGDHPLQGVGDPAQQIA